MRLDKIQIMLAILSYKDLKPLILKAVFICILALVNAVAFNYLRTAPLPWFWTPPPPVVAVIEELSTLQQLLLEPNTVLVDARHLLFHQMAHIPGSINLSLDENTPEVLNTWVQSLPPEASIIIYCSDRFCPMANDLAKKIIPLGHVPRIFTPGFEIWEAAGLPVESALPAASTPEVP